MTEAEHCTQCGAELVAGSCPACLLKLGLSGAVPVLHEPEPVPSPPSYRRWIWPVIAAIVIAAAAIGFLFLPPRQPPQRAMRLAILSPPQTTIGAQALSPDGLALAFSGVARNGETNLWMRRLDWSDARSLDGTSGAQFPFWSPDSRHVAFFAGGQLKRISAAGGYVQRICDAPNARGGAWSSNGTIVFAMAGGLSRVEARGGDAVPLAKPAPPMGFHAWPAFLPNERHVLYTVRGPRPDDSGIYVMDPKTGVKKRILSDLSNVVFTDRHLLFARDGMLMAQQYDPVRHDLVGEAFMVSEHVGYNAGRMYAAFSAAAGSLVYNQWGLPIEDQLAWIDRSGRTIGTVGEPGFHTLPELSPDGREMLALRPDRNGRSDLWLHDFVRGVASRFSFDQHSGRGVWFPDGRRIAFASHRTEGSGIYERAANGGGQDRLLVQTQGPVVPTSWSPDGRYLLYQAMNPMTKWDLLVIAASGDAKPRPAFPAMAFDEQNGVFSPDGRWIAYDSDESGRREVFVQAFESDAGKRVISIDGGSHPRWRQDGRELFYLSPDRQIMSVAIHPGGSLQTDTPHPLFLAELADPAAGFAVTSDGERFLLPVRAAGTEEHGATILINWR